MAGLSEQQAGPSVGRRQIISYNQTGQPSYESRSLTAADFLNPQPGDEFFHGERHDTVVLRLAQIMRHYYRFSPFAAVLSGVKLLWPDSTLPQPAPDLTVVANLSEPLRPRTVLDIAQEGATVRFVLEVTSPQLARVDLVQKGPIYAEAGVLEYFILDLGDFAGQTAWAPGADQPQAAPRLLAYRLDNGAYAPIGPDPAGRIFSETNKLWFQGDGAGNLLVIDPRTGAPIDPPPGEEEPPAVAQVEAALRARSIASQLDFLR
jgi:Uma2 family endonuclease